MSQIGRYWMLATAACFFCIGAADAQDDGFVATLKAETNFPMWPGTGGAVQGFNFQQAQYPALAGFSISSDTLTTDYLSYGVFRTLTFSNGSGSLTLKVGVGVSSVVNGHELFLRSDFTNRDLDLFDDLTRGDLLIVNPVSIGDLNFIPRNATASNLGGYIGFVRNNVFCVLADNANSLSAVDFSSLAKQLDSNIGAQSTPPINYAPPVVSFFPVSTTLSVSAADSTTAALSITDPTGNSGPIQRQFLDGGNLDVQDSGGPSVTISATSTTGSLRLTLVAVNAFLQFSSYAVVFFVIP